MTHNQYPAFWKFNKAGVFIEAMDLAAKADYRNTAGSPSVSIKDSSRSSGPVLATRKLEPTAPIGKLTPRFAAIMIGIVVLSGIFVANWIA